MVQLTPELGQALQSAHGEPLSVFDPVTQQTYYIITERDRELLREWAEEERVLEAFTEASRRDVAELLREDP